MNKKSMAISARWAEQRKLGVYTIGRKRKDPIETFEKYINKVPSGCWEWTGKIHKITGYGNFGSRIPGIKKSRTFLSHRFSYELYKTKIPYGMVIDHLCRNRKCVNPDHLEIVTTRENILRGTSFAARNAAKTHCIRGHELSGSNLYVTPDNRRQCRQCRSIPQNFVATKAG